MTRLLIAILAMGCTKLADPNERRDVGVVDTGVDATDAAPDTFDAGCDDPPIGSCPALCERARVSVGRVLDGVGRTVGRDETWPCDVIFVLEDLTYIQSDATVTIEPGTIIEAQPGAALVVTNGSRLVAEGTSQDPIVMRPSTGSWRGLTLLGDAPLAVEGGAQTQTVSRLHDLRSTYGGDDDAHDCGSLRYLRVEFAGVTDAGTEADSLFFGGCGSGTQVDFVQVREANADAIGLAGGGFDLRHLIVTSGDRDALRWGTGFDGSVQYFIVHLPVGSDFSALRADGPFDVTEPASAGVLANATTVSVRSDSAFEVDGSRLSVGNSIAFNHTHVMDLTGEHKTAFGLAVDVSNSIFNPVPAGAFFEDGVAERAFAPPLQGNSSADPLLPATGTTSVLGPNPSWRPAAGSPAETVHGVLPASVDATDYAGAVDPDPAVDDWTTGWTSYR